MLKSKIEKSISFSKIHYLWYSLVLCFPPVHELGHAFISVLCGDKIINFGYWYISREGYDHVRLIADHRADLGNTLWQYSSFISLCCVIVWGYLLLTKPDVHFDKRGCYGSETTI